MKFLATTALFFLPSLVIAGALHYKVHFSGLDDPEALKRVKGASFLTTLKEKTPISINALQFRAESAIPDIVKALHAQGYYDATASVQIVKKEDDIDVFVTLHPGPVYTLGAFDICIRSIDHSPITPDQLGMILHTPVRATEVMEAEQKALLALSEKGYPLATLLSRQMVADYATKTVSIHLEMDAGPLCRFGKTKIAGASSVKKRLFHKKTVWKEGEVYDAQLVEETQKKLLATGLFGAVLITHGEKEEGTLPMRIEATEAKHKNIHVGASWQTFFGPGLTFGWANRNVSGLGRTLSLNGDVTAKNHTGMATLFIPDCWHIDQDYVIQAQALQESLFAYHEQSYRFTQRVERRIDTKYRVSLGLRLERLLVTNSVDNGTFTLLEGPLYFRFSSANHLLNPTKGSTLEVKLIPSINLGEKLNRYYLYNAVSYACYLPLSTTDFFVLAQQVTASSIWSAFLSSVPVPKRILGGTDENLRGYHFKTASPRKGRKPIGGRFGLFYTNEGRVQLSKTLGLVIIFDLGLVELSSFPKWGEKWYKSIGLGARYFSFLCPIRFDAVIPLDRRKHIDPKYKIIISTGQTF